MVELSHFSKHPKNPNFKYSYGTAGFRFKADLLDSTVYRVAILASLRSKYVGSQVIGLMITASHNPPQDNGIKLVDPQGEMLETSWEAHATALANASTVEEFSEIYANIVTSMNINVNLPANIIYARDSRESGPALISALQDGLQDVGAAATNYGQLTTPQLHYLVRALNTQGTPYPYGAPTEQGYYHKLVRAYKSVLSSYKEPSHIVIDAANGIGAPKVKQIAREIGPLLDLTLVNDSYDKPELLNSNCGADFVKTQQKLPQGIDSSAQKNKLYASFDGDADRIIFFFIDSEGQFKLLDGDKIATFVASFLGDLVQQTGADLNIGVVQTAYANGSSTEYLTKKLKLPVEITPTGVKHLHHAAQHFEIGVYFEANGHGTVLFDSNAISKLQSHKVSSPAQKSAIDTLLALNDLINQTVGDAISDLLLVLAILTIKGWTPSDWDISYTDLPNRLLKVEVKDPTIFKTTDAERRLTSPPDLQTKIDELVKKFPQGRSFVRASGTENVVRVYAEAATRAQADELALKVSHLLEDY